MMDMLWHGARSVCVRLPGNGLYALEEPWRLFLNGEDRGAHATMVTSLYGLQPDTDYTLEAHRGDDTIMSVSFRTRKESYTLDVRAFGARGDGVTDDTAALQAAILSCPKDGRVLVPAGDYVVGPLFLKSNLRLQFEQNARLLLKTDRAQFPMLPGLLESWDEREYLDLGSWEGNPLTMYAALLTGIGVENVEITGPGVLDGRAQEADWWQDAKKRRGAWRPRMIFLNRCRNVTIQGVLVKNSPSWNIHPMFTQQLKLLNVAIEAPMDSPNTDGFNPESCTDVEVSGCRFSLGDDCIALKSGKLYMGSTRKTPSKSVTITHCLMEKGHGGVTIGSEMAGGVQDVLVKHCVMRHTDRGLRIKTRRGRGQQARVHGITFDNVLMEHVRAPIVVNCFYFCDPDGHAPHVQDRAPAPVDEGTPSIGKLAFKNIHATHCGAAAVFLLGLPEQPIEDVLLEDCHFSMDGQAEPFQPAMADGVPEMTGRGVLAHNVGELTLRQVRLEGVQGQPIETSGIGRMTTEDEHEHWHPPA